MTTTNAQETMLGNTTPTTKSRLGPADIAQQTIRTMLNDQKERAVLWSEFKGMLDGNPPIPHAEKRMSNRAWESNFNTLTGAAMIEQAIQPYAALFANGAQLATVQLKADNVDVAAQRSRVATEEFCRVLRCYGDLMDVFSTLCYSFVAFGKGFWMWETPYQWKPSVKKWYELLFPPNTPTDPEKWELFVVRNDLSPSTLYGYIRDEARAREAGWNPTAVLNAIKRANVPAEHNDDFLEVQRQLREHDLTTSRPLKTVNVGYIYAKEWDGKWTCAVVEREGVGTEKNPIQYLYFKQGVTKDIYDLICPFYFAPQGNGVNGCDGLARAIYSMVSASDVMTNKTLDGAILRALMLLNPRTQSSSAKAGITQVGNMGVLPWGFEVMPGNIMADISGPVTAQRLLDTILSKNTGVWRPSAEREIGNPATARENELRAMAQTRLGTTALERFGNYSDHAFRTMYNRLLEAADKPTSEEYGPDDAAKEFISRCKDRGVTKEMLKDPDWVGSFRVVGAGSQAQMQNIFGQMIPLAGSFPARGYGNFMEDVIAGVAGPSMVSRWYPRDVDEPGEGEWEAQVESGQASQGVPPMWTPNQDQIAHATTHLQQLQMAFMSMEKGGDAVLTYNYCTVMLPHTAQHISAVGRDKTQKARFQQMEHQLQVYTQQYRQLEQAAKQQLEDRQVQQQAAAVQQGLTPDVALKSAKAQKQMEISEFKAVRKAQIEQAQAGQEMAIKGVKAQQDLAITAAKAATENIVKLRQSNKTNPQ